MKFNILFIILFQFLYLITNGQVSTTKVFSSKSGFCSTTIMLDSLGNFYRESGCEGRSYISFGTYRYKNGIVEFRFLNFDSINPVNNILESTSRKNDSTVFITFLTKQGEPVSNSHFSVDAIDSSGKFLKTYRLDSVGRIEINFKKYKEIRLPYLAKIFTKKVRIEILKNNYTIQLNLPDLFFYYPNTKTESGNVFSLVLKKDGLYSLNGKEKEFSLVE